ncbi:RNA-binding domain-containing protein [Aspergillus uvarum CBS 121591]|uniref:RNA-binding domain-containing protein n=1 Tax=Aspergillus uvarum CBS 121591 TaxID=1448315 RepID=A0A319DR54_9EURO|nr:RNA-binding domain-containing protein [Aspergillus uvarum CBS 121591]PYH81692.1 RNA-binding domain-containing protein [Aspergillus uvarum CBS 121591]
MDPLAVSDSFLYTHTMYCFRQAASRLLIAPSRVAIRSVPRSNASSPLRLAFASRPVQSQLQSRWNSDDAQNKPVAPSTTGQSPEISNESIAEAVSQYADQKENSSEQAAAPEQAATEESFASEAPRQRFYQRDQDGNGGSGLRRYRGAINREEPQPKTTIFVGNLFYDVTSDDLRRFFTKFGDVQRVNLIHDQRGISKGFGYVDFESIESAQRAIEEMHLQIFEGRRISVMFAQNGMKKHKVSPPSKSLYIGNLPFEMTDRDLNDLFNDVVNVIDVRVAIDRRTGQPRGFAHADFVDLESACNAMEILSKKMPYGKKLRLDYSSKHKGINNPNSRRVEEEQQQQQQQQE